MSYFFILDALRCSLILLLIFACSCTAVPEADFYEVDGVISIRAESLSNHQGWNLYENHSTVSLISVSGSPDNIEPLIFPFYIRQPGVYSVWILGNRELAGSDRDHLSISILDEQDEQLYQTLIHIDSGPILKWMNSDFDDRPISFQVDRPGHYRMKIRSMGLEGYMINKIHLTLNNGLQPFGAGFTETSDPFLDPILMRREQRVELPEAMVFGPVFGGYSEEGDRLNGAEIIRKYGIGYNEIRKWERAPDFGQYEVGDLRKNIEIVSNPLLITFELPFASYDVGGYDYKESPPFDEELLIRWTQFSAFNSVMHLFLHEIYDRLAIEGLLTSESRDYIDDLVRLRKSLFPYIYSEYHLMRGTGVRPIRGNSDYPTQFMFGDSFLAAPMYEVGEDERFVRLPSGIWYDYVDGTRYEGGQSWLVEAPVHRIPIFVKAGAIIPYRMESESMYPAHYDSLLLEIYGGSVGTFRLYEDDGVSTRYKQGQFTTTAFRYFERDDYATFTIGRMVREFEWQSPEKKLTLHFKYVRKPVSVSANAEELSEGKGLGQWYYDNNRGMLIVNWSQPNQVKTDFEIRF